MLVYSYFLDDWIISITSIFYLQQCVLKTVIPFLIVLKYFCYKTLCLAVRQLLILLVYSCLTIFLFIKRLWVLMSNIFPFPRYAILCIFHHFPLKWLQHKKGETPYIINLKFNNNIEASCYLNTVVYVKVTLNLLCDTAMYCVKYSTSIYSHKLER